MSESCLLCKARKPGWFCDLSPRVLADMEAMSTHAVRPMGSILFSEGQASRNVWVVCAGQVKLLQAILRE